jgi:carbohydrate kinase (thermoresistant glucokinase family)
MTKPVLVVMGVSGAGKSTIAEALNTHLHWPYQEGDDLHSAGNIAKMAHHIPLTDADRWPWLDRVKAWIDTRVAAGEPGLITCSALKRIYRNRLIAGRAVVRILYLRADVQTLQDHVEQRTGHFMPPDLLKSQLATLEEPTPDENPITVQIAGQVADTVAAILQQLRPLLSET